MKKLDGKSMDLEKHSIEKIKELFPEVVIEGKIDFDKLRLILGDEVDESIEKYQFTWNGKSQTIKLAQKPSNGTLRPAKEEGKDWDTTENLYIEGDNLEVLKQLQKTYFGKIKMIYIDPPYNTGGDFVYKDDFKDNIKNYKEQTNQTSRSNADTSGRYHTDWLNMMYSRLMLAKNLLTENGVTAINIDENEYFNLAKIVTEIFGHDNLDTLVWRKNGKQGNTKKISRFKNTHEYILVGYKNRKITNVGKMKLFPNWKNEYKNHDNDPRGVYKAGNISNKEEKSNKNSENFYAVSTPTNVVYEREWFISKEEFERLDNDKVKTSDGKLVGRIYYPRNGDGVPALKIFENEEQEYYFDSIIDEMGTFTDAREELKNIFNGNDLFDTPKPEKLLRELVRANTNSKDIVVDFFSGSATTAHAVMKLNAEEGGNRKFIMVQLPEKTDEKSEAYKAGYKNICEIGKERIRRAGEQIKQEMEKEGKDSSNLDIGFKVFKLDDTNIKEWDSSKEVTDSTLFDQQEVFKEGRTTEDVLHEILLKYGVFDMPVSKTLVNNKVAYDIGKGDMIVALFDDITSEDVKAIAEKKPRVVIFKDSGFANDNVKLNALHNLEKQGVEDIKSI